VLRWRAALARHTAQFCYHQAAAHLLECDHDLTAGDLIALIQRPADYAFAAMHFCKGRMTGRAEPDGSGKSLTRVSFSAYGNDPANWQPALPTPGWTAPEE